MVAVAQGLAGRGTLSGMSASTGPRAPTPEEKAALNRFLANAADAIGDATEKAGGRAYIDWGPDAVDRLVKLATDGRAAMPQGDLAPVFHWMLSEAGPKLMWAFRCVFRGNGIAPDREHRVHVAVRAAQQAAIRDDWTAVRQAFDVAADAAVVP